jgi:hypothetical protein
VCWAAHSMADETLHELGPVPSDIDALIERYLGTRRITAAQADAMLQALQSGSGSLPPASASNPPPGLPPNLRTGRRYNTPFPQGLAGADELPELNSGRGLRTPPPGFYPPVKPAVAPMSTSMSMSTPPPPSVFSPPSASAAWLPAPEESAVIPVARTPVPASLTPVPAAFPPDSVFPPAPRSAFPPATDLPPPAAGEPAPRSSRPVAAVSPQPMSAADAGKEDSFEILVDDEMLELEADDLLIEDVTDEDDDV